jgi:hypothetical protein
MILHTRRAAICTCVLAGVLVGVADGHPRERIEQRPELWQERGVDMREQPGRSMADFLSADGQFDLEAIRRSGYQGPLDLGAHDVRLDPRTGRPMVSDKEPGVARDHPDDDYWQPGMGVPGVDGDVIAAVVYDNALIVGGSFSLAGEVPANRIARWDGTSWSALGSGMNGDVYALAVYDNALIAGGSFMEAGGVTANRIARWDGTGWSALGSGMNARVDALAVYDNALIAGGWFTTAGGEVSAYLAFWNPNDATSIGDDPGSDDGPQATIPTALAISTVAPNPFNPRTTVWLDIPRAGGVTLAVHDLRGRLVRTLLSGRMSEGRHPVVWEGLDDGGARTPSGVYLVRLVTADGAQRAVKVTLSK